MIPSLEIKQRLFSSDCTGIMRIGPEESFTVKVKLPPLTLYVYGLSWQSKRRFKAEKRKLRLAHLQAIKEDVRRTGRKFGVRLPNRFYHASFVMPITWEQREI